MRSGFFLRRGGALLTVVAALSVMAAPGVAWTWGRTAEDARPQAVEPRRAPPPACGDRAPGDGFLGRTVLVVDLTDAKSRS